ncbi:MAG: methyltransferase domain-containing protein [bacterium]
MFSDPLKNLRAFGLREDMIVADLGAGTGFYALAAASLVPSGKVYAIEIQKDYLATIQNKAKEAKVANLECIWGQHRKAGRHQARRCRYRCGHRFQRILPSREQGPLHRGSQAHPEAGRQDPFRRLVGEFRSRPQAGCVGDQGESSRTFRDQGLRIRPRH